jgi:hypothetical protein
MTEKFDIKKSVEYQIGITPKRHNEISQIQAEILPKNKPYAGTSELINLYADELRFSRRELVYLGLLLCATYESAEGC